MLQDQDKKYAKRRRRPNANYHNSHSYDLTSSGSKDTAKVSTLDSVQNYTKAILEPLHSPKAKALYTYESRLDFRTTQCGHSRITMT